MRMSEMSMVMIKGEDEKRHEGKYEVLWWKIHNELGVKRYLK